MTSGSTGPSAQGLRSLPPLGGKTRRYHSVACDDDGWCLGASEKGLIDIWRLPRQADAPAEGPFRAFRASKAALHDVAIAPDGRRLASASSDGGLYVWEVPSVPGGRDIEPIAPQSTWWGHTAAARALAWTRDGKRIVSAGDDDRVAVYRVRDGAIETAQSKGGAANALALHPLEAQVVTGHDDDGVRLWNLADDQPPTLAATQALHDGWWKRFVNRVTALAFSPDGQLIVAGSTRDAAVHLLRWPDLHRLMAFNPLQEPVSALTFGSGGQLAVGGRKGALAIVDLAARRVVAAARLTPTITGLAWRGEHLVAATGADRLYPLAPGA